jgi:hypothetical protein
LLREENITMMPKASNFLSDDAIAARIELLDEIRHGLDQTDQVHGLLNLARAEARQRRIARKRFLEEHPGLAFLAPPNPVVIVVGPRGVGKSHIIKTYQERFSMKENWPAGIRHVVNAELSPDANKRQVQVDILTAFQDPNPDTGTDGKLRRRVRVICDNMETDLTLVDEVQHFIASDGSTKRSSSVVDALKKHLNSGVSALGLFGTEALDKIFEFGGSSGGEFGERGFARIELSGLRDTTEHRRAYKNFLRTFRVGIEQRRIVEHAGVLEEDQTIGCLFEQAFRRYGTTQRLLKGALRVSLMRGGTALLPRDFAIAVETLKALYGFKENLFVAHAMSSPDEI